MFFFFPFLHGLVTNTTCRRLELQGNSIHGAGTATLAKVLRRNKSLPNLRLEWNQIGAMDSPAFSSFCDAFSVNKSLIGLNLRNNDTNHVGGSELATALKRNVTLRVLALFIQLLTIIIVYHYMKPQLLLPVVSINSHDYSHNTNRNTKYNQLIQICMVFSPRHTYRSRKRSMSLIITLIAFIFHCLASLSFGVPFLWFQLNYPFCWSGKLTFLQQENKK
ncbi:unnamed protein product [Rotaria sp. Silwood2]|nr:unnamed protein product [Rotaria sp. Silwood2]